MTTRLLAITVLVSAITTSAVAQVTYVQPTVIQQEPALNSFLSFRWYDANNVLKGQLRYTGNNPAGSRYFGFSNVGADYLAFFSNTFTAFFAGDEQLRILSTGVRIGTNPAETATKLTVNGAINVTGNIAAKYQDVAEWVPSFGDPQPGTVVVLSEDASNHVVASHQAYDTRVAGVISQQPGVILGEPGDTKVQVATTGRVKVMVDATNAPIKIGDLLVTSDKPGVAMKSMPVEVGGFEMHRPGTLVGKALEPLAEGTGEILVLLSLQ